MKLQDHIDIKGQLTLQLRNKAEEIVEEYAVDNSIVLSGRDLVAKQFINMTIDPVSHLAVGVGSKEVDPATDTELDNELLPRKRIDPIVPSEHLTETEDNKKKVFISAELDFHEGNGALTEAGLFNADAGGVMYNRVFFPTINKTEDFKLTLIWEIIF